MTDYDEAQKLKITLKKWETDFVKEHKRKPKKDDIECAPTEIQDTYKDYNRLKRKIQERIDNKSSSRDQDENCETLKENTNNPSPKLENKDKSPTDRSQAEELTSPDDIPVWGRQLDRKKGGKEHESKSDSGGKNSCNYLQKLSSKLFDVSKKIGNTKPAFRRSAPLVANKINSSSNVQEDGVKSDIYDYSNTTENFKIKNELFEKAASLAIKKQVPVEDDPEKVILPDKFKVRQKPKLPIFSKSPCNIEYDLNHEAVSNNKRYPPNDWDEVDNLKPFADESDKFSSGMTTQGQPSFQSGCHTDLINHESQYEIKPSRRQQKHFKDPEEAMDTSFNSESENKTKIDTEITRQRQTVKGNVSKVKKTDKEDQAESISNNEVYNYHETDNVPILPKHGKRKAAEKSNEGPSKKRKIKVVENDEMDDNEGKTDEAADGLRRPKAPSRSKPAASSTSSDNFVKLNMKLKTYKRKGKRQMTGPQMRRFQWKQKMKARSQSYENKCFKCGQEGHWANKCSGGGKNKEEIDDKPPVLEEDFPTLKQASMMAKGVKLETKMKKQKDIEHLSKEPAKEEEEDFDDLDIEAGVVRNIREAIEAPPPMEPFLTEEEYSSSDIPSSVKKGLKKFGYERFRHGQQQAVLRILSGKSTLVILSTGGGKSLTYQLPAVLYAEKSTCFTLVISPLVSLMEDQITGLPPGVRGACLHTNMTKAQRESVMESVKEGKVHFLLVSPEAIAGGTMSVLTSASNLPPISFVCIDEAHCLSEWSHNFRPSYLRLTKVLRERFGVQCFLGLTATATQSTAADVAKHLGIDNLEKAVVRGPPVPKNLMLSVSRDELRDEALIGLLQGERFSHCESIIVYCTRREATDRLATLIRTSLQDQKGENWTGDRTKRKGGKKQYNYWDAESYHAGLSPAARKRVQNAFMSGRLRVVVATVAFGMGLDKSNVRGVIHYNMPKSFESYVQEIGRAGRDGKESHCHVFLDPEGKDLSELRRHTYSNTVDYRTLKKFIQRVFEPCRCVEVNKRHKEAVQEKRAVDSTEANREDDDELFDDWDEDEDQKKGRICLGHERAIPIESFVSELDVKEEGIATLFCYLELHPDNSWKVENLTNVYSTCSIQCYGGPVVLQEIAKKCPPVAVAIAKAKKDGKTFAGKTSIDFPVVEISDCMGWDSGPVKRELKMLMWNLTGASGPKRTSVMVEFTDLAFHYRAPGDLSEDEIDDVIMSLHNRIQRQEKSELGNLRYLFDTLHSVSHKNYWMCTDDLDEKKNAKLKTILEDYFQEQTDYKAAIRDVHDEELSYELNQVLSDIRQFINMYSNEHKLHGRAIARVFHGIGSPCFPATTWGRVRRFWRSHINVDFNLLIKLATKELIKMR